jgi:Sec23-binding domain of Sec16
LIANDSLELGKALHLILAGKSEEAAKEAARRKCFALSLILASMCGPKMYEQAIANYAHSELAAGSPFYTLCMLLSGQVKPSLQIWGEDLASLRHTWKSHLAAILNVRGKGWDLFAVSLGDALKSIEETEASHFCYLVCGCPIASPARKDSRLTLIGRDVGSSDLTLTTEESLSAFEKTEAYEWTKLKRKPNASIESLQPFKLMYAMLLADYGFEHAASSYVRSLKLFIGAPTSSTQRPLGPLSLAMLSCDRQSLLAYLDAFEARLMKRCSSEKEDSRRLVHTLRESDTRDSFMSARSSASLIQSDDVSLNGSGRGSRRQQLQEVSQEEDSATHVHSLPGILESPSLGAPKKLDMAVINPPMFRQDYNSKDVSSSSQALETPKASDSKPPDQAPITAVTPSDAPSKPPKAPMSAPANLQQGRTSTPSSGKSKSKSFPLQLSHYIMVSLFFFQSHFSRLGSQQGS